MESTLPDDFADLDRDDQRQVLEQVMSDFDGGPTGDDGVLRSTRPDSLGCVRDR
jgi:hypothetical protein